MKIFVDTNVFFYALDDRLPTKFDRCRNWIDALDRAQCGAANLQVANEFTNVVLKRMPDLVDEAVFALADHIMIWGRNAIRRETVAVARQIRGRYAYSWWDCLLLASALELDCTHFLSEDLQDGQVLGGLTIVDPFAHSPDQILALR